MKLLEPHQHLASRRKVSGPKVGIFASLAALVGVIVVVSTLAAGTPIAFEPESGTLTAPATNTTVTGQSGAGAVKFGSAPTPTPTPGGFQANCIVSPHVCGYPDATNTGVPAGTTLTNSTGVTVTTNGAVVQNLNITGDGQIVVKANNVTIKNVKIIGCTYYPIDYDDGLYSGLVIQDSEIGGTCSSVTAGMSFSGYTATRLNVYGGADGFKANSNVTIQDSYIHNLWVTADSHNDGTQSTGGSNVTLRHNTYDVGSDGVCVQFGSTDTGWLVTNNLFHCGGWSLNGGTGTSDSTFTNNRFAKVPGYYGPSGLGSSPRLTWTGNYFDDTGAVVSQ
jgi:hypothetical protein